MLRYSLLYTQSMLLIIMKRINQVQVIHQAQEQDQRVINQQHGMWIWSSGFK
jgi:hypothetical protein